MRRTILIAATLLLVVPLLSGCGVAQEEYDAVVAESDTAKAQVSSLQNDLAAVESDLAAVESDLAAVESDLAAVESDLAAVESDLAAVESAKAGAESALAGAEAQVVELEAQIAELEAQAAELEAQIAQMEAAAEEEAEVAEEEEVWYTLEVLWSAAQLCCPPILTGSVKNISDESLKDVEVLFFAYDSQGNLACRASALIRKNPLLPGESSPFEVKMYECDKAVASYSVHFRFLNGDIIPSYPYY